MVFELFEKGSHTIGGLKPKQVSVAKTSMTLGSDSVKIMKDGFVEVWLDYANKRVGLRNCNNQVKGFKLHFHKEKSGKSGNPYITGTFVNLLPRGLYESYQEKEEGTGRLFVVFEVTEIARKEKNE